MKEAIQKVDKAKTKEQSKESVDALRLAHDKLQVYPNLRPRLCRLRHVFVGASLTLFVGSRRCRLPEMRVTRRFGN